MGTTLGAISVLGFFLCIIWLILRLIRRKPAKPAGVGLLVCIILFFVGVGVMMATGEVETSKDADPPKQEEDGAENTVPDLEPPTISDTTDGQDEAQKNLKSALGGSSVLFYNYVNNDVTGRWRMLVYYSAESIVDHAAEYYDAYFESDDEVHVVVNLGLRTTSTITCSLGSLYIDVHEYVEDEEHDAKVLGNGTLLNSYIVDLSSGKVDDLSSITSESGETISLKAIEDSIIAALPEEYQSSKWFYIQCDTYGDGSVSVDLQIDQGNDDFDAALSLCAQYFELSKKIVENEGAVFAIFRITVVDSGAPVGLFSTSDGENFVSISDGKRTEISFS